MKKSRQHGFVGLELLLLLIILVAAGLAGSYIWKQHHRGSITEPVVTHVPGKASGCSQSAKIPQVAEPILVEAKKAFIAKGFTSAWLDQHFQLTDAVSNANTINDPSIKWEVKPHATTILSYQMCVGNYNVTVRYQHSDDGSSKSFAEIYAPTHDINSVVTQRAAEASLAKCGGELSGSFSDSVIFRDIEDNGALYPKQTRLYVQGTVPDSSGASNGSSAPLGGQGGIRKMTDTYVDLETGKCFQTTTAIGI